MSDDTQANDQHSQEQGLESVNELKKALVNELVTALEEKKLPQKEVREAANYILDNLAADADLPAMIAFLEDLAGKWPIFQSTAQVYKGKSAGSQEVKAEEQEVINKLEDYIKSMDE